MQLRPGSFLTAQSSMGLEYFLGIYCELGLNKHIFLCQSSGKDGTLTSGAVKPAPVSAP